MNKYLIMRDNEPTGPFSLEQLKSLQVQSNDKVWVKGYSDKWTYAIEVEELRQALGLKGQVETAFDTSLSSLDGLSPHENKFNSPVSNPANPMEKSNKTRFYKTSLIVSVLLVLLLGGILIKKSIEPEVVEIKDVAVAPPAGEAATNSENFQNALSKEFIPVETKPKKVKPKELKKMVSVKANKYEVKILGGIKDLEITVENFSEHLLDQVTIKVEYLKPKGEVINSEMITISDIKAGNAKTIEVPPSPRGVKIKYEITDIVSKEYKAVLDEL